ncbi:ABC transporter related [Alicyclobacillus acidocaldarius subsp. acidocaldarius DSM 446]|uniref:ABC transporter related n=1 Tax=Alicyclobacillus acidocaldarius subsp. acidocaldarius (strain ATCC 27009 / DSM 446 / BCRC 14685 / JCM 5260 / KCTC 1825 / NBRC 15652 / NCIMB 11725 / NRRL B-14509 / 104-IA) TaxID=521098 RepID=C8WWQ8_ALIAD|nr:ABC transporter related [Alicyclobacillus acidocaldarius subsp. acidocaldarius DSM 446]
MKPILKLEGVTKVYSSGTRHQMVLRDVNLSVFEGEFLAVVGPSGGGKSTLLNILGCLITPDNGSYFVHGKKVNWKSTRQLSHLRGGVLATVFQGFELVSHWAVSENVEVGLRMRSIPKGKRIQTVIEMLRKVGMVQHIHKYPNELSGGEQQRVAIARALCTDPQVLLADEPTGNLDPENTKEILAIFRNLHEQGKTIVMVTHDMKVAEQAQRVVTLRGGRLESGMGFGASDEYA